MFSFRRTFINICTRRLDITVDSVIFSGKRNLPTTIRNMICYSYVRTVPEEVLRLLQVPVDRLQRLQEVLLG